MLEVFAIAIMLTLWHAVLTRFGAVPGWTRTVLRLCFAGTVLAEAALYAWVTWRTSRVAMQDFHVVLTQVQRWSDAAHITSAALLGTATVLLIALTVRAVLSRRSADTR